MRHRRHCNMHRYDSTLRLILGSALLLYSVLNACVIGAVIAMFLFYTGLTRFCLFYHLLRINERFNLKNYYLSQLPIYNTQAVFIFNAKGEVVFKNQSAEENFTQIINPEDFGLKDAKDLIISDGTKTLVFEDHGKKCQIIFRGVSAESFLLAYAGDVTQIFDLTREMEETQREIIYAMGQIGETRSQETGNHVKRVALYSELLAQLSGMSFEEAKRLKMASPMHDIGKVGIPDAILNAPRRLNKEEFEIMKTHATLGYEMLKHSNKPILQAAAIVAHEHHEKYDGSGYPRGLKGEAIHVFGRITAIADVFDALGSERVYKKAWSLEKILEMFEAEKGRHFDPELIDLFRDNLDRFVQIRDQYKD